MVDILDRHIQGVPYLKRSQVTADLFLGGHYDLVGLSKLKAMGITAIVNMRENSVYRKAQYEGIKYLHLPNVDNSPPSLMDLIRGADFVDNEIRIHRGKVYIHCRHGLGRGPSIAIAYLLKLGTTYDDAFSRVQKVRTFFNPRPAQRARLEELAEFYEASGERENISAKHAT